MENDVFRVREGMYDERPLPGRGIGLGLSAIRNVDIKLLRRWAIVTSPMRNVRLLPSHHWLSPC